MIPIVYAQHLFLQPVIALRTGTAFIRMMSLLLTVVIPVSYTHLCDADTLGSCGYVYLAVYPATETESNPPE